VVRLINVPGSNVRLYLVPKNLPDILGKTSDIIDPFGVYHYEISRILLFRVHECRPEYLVEWTGFDSCDSDKRRVGSSGCFTSV
jgi:hypothetical protein